MKSFNESRIVQEAPEKNYKLVLISHDDPNDTNDTGVLIRDTAKKMGIEVHLCEFMGAYLTRKGKKTFLNSFKVNKEGDIETLGGDKGITDGKDHMQEPIELDDNTLIMVRGIGTSGISGNASWKNLAFQLEQEGHSVVNSTQCHWYCADKDLNQYMFEKEHFTTPITTRMTHSEDGVEAMKRIGDEFPVILKTGTGSRGIGVVYIESHKTLRAIAQLLYRESEWTDILLQEFVKCKYDVRAIVCCGEVIGAMKRPIVDGDFRSNVSQGSKAEAMELTEKEIAECIRAADCVEAKISGVDFIPATDREKGEPIFIEVNSTPGLKGIAEVIPNIVKDVLKCFYNREFWK
jgi:RimK family alpha-L-glutamate ligase